MGKSGPKGIPTDIGMEPRFIEQNRLGPRVMAGGFSYTGYMYPFHATGVDHAAFCTFSYDIEENTAASCWFLVR